MLIGQRALDQSDDGGLPFEERGVASALAESEGTGAGVSRGGYQHVRRTNQFIAKADRLLNEVFDGRYCLSGLVSLFAAWFRFSSFQMPYVVACPPIVKNVREIKSMKGKL